LTKEAELRPEAASFLAMIKKTVRLKVIEAPRVGHVVNAPPLVKVSDHTVEYLCGRCGVAIMHAEEDQVHGAIFRCTKCGSYNRID
jgi:predicted RNA-binding Zn-ribbon protein involved in translation (DUF1610 family)